MEVQGRGKYWQWRKGRAESRQCRYGGKFETLSEDRQNEYKENREAYQQRRSRTDTNVSGRILPKVRHENFSQVGTG